MKAMILAAGFGTRLKDLTKSVPKCLIPLCDGSTMLDRIVQRLKRAGIKEIIINLHYLPEKIKEHVTSKKNYDIEIEFSIEDKILGTGGGLKKARRFFDKNPFILHNSDVFSSIPIDKLIQEQKKKDALVTLAVMKRETSRPLLFDKKLNLVGFGVGETKQLITPNTKIIPDPFGFSGIQVISTRFFEYLEMFEGEFSTIPAFFNAAKAKEKVIGVDVSDSAWIDMGKPEDLKQLNQILGQNIKTLIDI